MKKHWILFAAVLIPAMILSACTPGGGSVAASKLKRVANPDVLAADLSQLTAGNTAFAFDLYQAVRGMDGNLVYSPYSISLAFAMTYGGARGTTESQMADVLHYSLPAGRFHPAFNALDLDLAARPTQLTDVPVNERFTLNIANSLWGQRDWPFLPDFLDLLATNYGAGMRLVDFQNASESARQQINNWVADQTRQRIKDIIPPGAIDSSTRLALANAIYFKARWESEFSANDTSDQQFHLLNGDTTTVSMMSTGHARSYSYAAGDGWQAVAMPYKGGLTEMVAIVPDEGTFESFESSLTADRYNGIVSAMTPQQVDLSIPKFTFETGYQLSDTLVRMGMPDAFDPNAADFSGIDGRQDLYISSVLHKAFIAVDEKGTEAAAATVVIVGVSALPPAGITLTIDRPFFFFIRDVPTGTVLFMGRVLDPQ